MEDWWNIINKGKTEILGEKPVPLPLCLPQIPHGLTWERICALHGGTPSASLLKYGTKTKSYLRTRRYIFGVKVSWDVYTVQIGKYLRVLETLSLDC
jgi:hypothetical protein